MNEINTVFAILSWAFLNEAGISLRIKSAPGHWENLDGAGGEGGGSGDRDGEHM